MSDEIRKVPIHSPNGGVVGSPRPSNPVNSGGSGRPDAGYYMRHEHSAGVHDAYYGQSDWDSSYNNWNRGTSFASAVDEALFPEIAADNAAIRERNKWLEQADYNSPANQMARMKEAGINPNLAAAGIAEVSQSQTSSGAPQAQPQNPAAMLSGLTDAANLVNAGVGAFEKGMLTLPQRRLLEAEKVSALEKAGLDHWSAMSIVTMLPYEQANKQADTYLKLANFERTMQDYKNLKAEHDNIVAENSKIWQEIDLLKRQGNLADAMKMEAEARTAQLYEDTRWKKAENDFWDEKGYLRSSPTDNALMNAAVNGNHGIANTIGEAVQDYNYKSQYGIEKAGADFAPYKAKIEAHRHALEEFYNMLMENPNDLKGLAAKLGNIIGNFQTGFDIENNNEVYSAKKPEK